MMQPILSTLVKIPNEAFFEVSLGPFYILIDCCKLIIQHKRIEGRYIFIASVVILGLIAGIIASLVSHDIQTFWNNVFPSTKGSGFFPVYLTAWLLSYPPAIIAKYGVNIYFIYGYGHEKYYLDYRRTNELSRKCNIQATDLLAVFNFVREEFCNGKVFLHSNSQPLEKVLEIFMYEGPTAVVDQYTLLRGFYDAELLLRNDMHLLQDTQRMNALGKRYGVDQEAIKTVLQFCVENFAADLNATGVRKEDYASIIRKLLSGSEAWLFDFINQQIHAKEDHRAIANLQRKHIRNIAHLKSLQNERLPSSSSPRASEIDDEEIFKDALSPDDREALATDLYKRAKSLDSEQEENLAINRKLSREELGEVLKHLDHQLEYLNSALQQAPPTLSDAELQLLIHSVDDCLAIRSGSSVRRDIFSEIRSRAQSDNTYPSALIWSRPSPALIKQTISATEKLIKNNKLLSIV